MAGTTPVFTRAGEADAKSHVRACVVGNVDVARPPGVTALGVAASTAIHVLSLAIPLALFQTYDRILPNQAYGTTFVLAVGVIIAIVLEAILRYGRAVLLAYVGASFEAQGTVRLLETVLRADGRALHQLTMANLVWGLRAVWEVRDHWSGTAAVALHELPFAVIYIALITYIATWLALVPLALTVVAAVFALAVVRSTAAAVQEAEEAQLQRRSLVWGVFLGLVEAKAMAAESLFTRRHRDALARAMHATIRVENREALVAENGALLAQLATIGVVTAGAFMVIDGHLTTGGLAACTLLAGRSIGPTISAFGYFSRHNQRLGAEDRIGRVLSLPPAPVWAGSVMPEKRLFAGGTIVLTGAALPDGAVSIPQGIFLRIDAPDSLVATAALRTVVRLDDWPGLSVTFNGEPSSVYEPQSLRRGIAGVSSRGELIRGSLLDNLTLFSPQYEAGAIQLAERLGLSPFVDGLRQGYMTPVGFGSAELISPGISARIGMIRALVRQPLVLCLDQVASSLDLDGLKRLSQLLSELKGHTTVVFASQMPMLIALADRTVRVTRPPAPSFPHLATPPLPAAAE
ncbi:MAG TPA: ABC transporter transmembrane domain-containing protein [Stellaceae bacterium]|nr:ABC transporter transmembrane domain-containing protein [Stellaceae bacterium]